MDWEKATKSVTKVLHAIDKCSFGCRFRGAICTNLKAGDKLKILTLGDSDRFILPFQRVLPADQFNGDIFLRRTKKYHALYVVCQGKYVLIDRVKFNKKGQRVR